jgi:hypothetical protein
MVVFAVWAGCQGWLWGGTLRVVYEADTKGLQEDPAAVALEGGKKLSELPGGLFHEGNPDPKAKELALAVKLMFDSLLSGDSEKIRTLYKPIPENEKILKQFENPQFVEAYRKFAAGVGSYEPDFYFEGPKAQAEQKTTYYVFVRLKEAATGKEQHQIFGFLNSPEGWFPVHLNLTREQAPITNVIVGLQQGKATVTVVE